MIKCKMCGKPFDKIQSDGVAYCDECIEKIRIKNPRTYVPLLERYFTAKELKEYLESERK